MNIDIINNFKNINRIGFLQNIDKNPSGVKKYWFADDKTCDTISIQKVRGFL